MTDECRAVDKGYPFLPCQRPKGHSGQHEYTKTWTSPLCDATLRFEGRDYMCVKTVDHSGQHENFVGVVYRGAVRGVAVTITSEKISWKEVENG